MCFILGEATVDANHNLRRINVGYGVRKVWAFSSVLLGSAFFGDFACFGVHLLGLDFMLQSIEAGCRAGGLGRRIIIKSEEHTSELQSIMRISYAVFCLKKKHNNEDTYKYTT